MPTVQYYIPRTSQVSTTCYLACPTSLYAFYRRTYRYMYVSSVENNTRGNISGVQAGSYVLSTVFNYSIIVSRIYTSKYSRLYRKSLATARRIYTATSLEVPDTRVWYINPDNASPCPVRTRGWTYKAVQLRQQ